MTTRTASCRCGQLRETTGANAAQDELGEDAGLDALVRLTLRKAAK